MTETKENKMELVFTYAGNESKKTMEYVREFAQFQYLFGDSLSSKYKVMAEKEHFNEVLDESGYSQDDEYEITDPWIDYFSTSGFFLPLTEDEANGLYGEKEIKKFCEDVQKFEPLTILDIWFNDKTYDVVWLVEKYDGSRDRSGYAVFRKFYKDAESDNPYTSVHYYSRYSEALNFCKNDLDADRKAIIEGDEKIKELNELLEKFRKRHPVAKHPLKKLQKDQK